MWNFDAKSQVTEILTKTFFLAVMGLIVTLVKEVKPVITEERHLDNGDESRW